MLALQVRYCLCRRRRRRNSPSLNNNLRFACWLINISFARLTRRRRRAHFVETSAARLDERWPNEAVLMLLLLLLLPTAPVTQRAKKKSTSERVGCQVNARKRDNSSLPLTCSAVVNPIQLFPLATLRLRLALCGSRSLLYLWLIWLACQAKANRALDSRSGSSFFFFFYRCHCRCSCCRR